MNKISKLELNLEDINIILLNKINSLIKNFNNISKGEILNNLYDLKYLNYRA